MITSDIPDTSEVQESTGNAYITFAKTTSAGDRPSVTIGTGDTGNVAVGSVTISYENRRVRPGQLYYFFVRLYSSVVGSGVVSLPINFTAASNFFLSRRIKKTSVTVFPGDLLSVSPHQKQQLEIFSLDV